MRRSVLVGLIAVVGCSATETQKAQPAPAPVITEQPQKEILQQAASDDSDLPRGRLPGYIHPAAYGIDLTIDPSHKGFSGHVSIHVAMASARDHIWLHGSGLRVSSATVRTTDGRILNVRYRETGVEGVARVDFGETLKPQDLMLIFDYEADYGKALQGIYSVKADNEPYVFAQFEPISARTAFPCFDEPGYKTPFDVTITTRASDVAISNATAIGEETHGGMKTTRFARTEKLPTYLVTFAAGPFDVVDAGAIPANDVRKDAVPLRGIAVRGKGALMQESLTATKDLLVALESYFGIGYPFGKLDMIAVPEFAFGAMENAGAITFRDVLLLLDPATATIELRRNSASVIAHELAHQWFGNIVTPAWWDDIWLNEAFATWLEYTVVQQVRPAFTAEMMRTERGLDAMQRDALPSARQIRQPIDANDAIHSAFDPITYSKGMQVLSMFEAYVGADNFRKAVQLHLTKFRGGNATADDFFTSVSEGTGKDLTSALRGFIEQNGLPQVDVDIICAKKEQPKLLMRQSRFLPLMAANDGKHRWQIPVCVRTDATKACWLLDTPEQTNTLDVKTCPKWVMPNANAAGYYRFALDPAPLKALVSAAVDGKLSPSETLALASNLRAGLYNGTLSAQAALEAAVGLLKSPHYQVVARARDVLLTVREIIEPSLLTRYEVWVRNMLPHDDYVSVIANEHDEKHLTRVVRSEIAVILGRDPAVRDKAHAMGEQALAALEAGQPLTGIVNLDMLPAALSAALDAGGAAVHDRIANVLGKTSDPAVRRYLLKSLAASHDPGLAQKSVDLMLDPRVRSNETRIVLEPLSQTRETRPVVWAFIQNRFDDYIGKVSARDQGVVPLLTSDFCTPEAVREVERFFMPKLDHMPGGARSLLIATESISACSAMADTQRNSAHGAFWGYRPAVKK